jgi:hypothetical protein
MLARGTMLRNIIAIFSVTVALKSCITSSAPEVDAQTGLRATGNETSVVIEPTDDAAKAFPLAERHCVNFGKYAHFSRMEGSRQIFDCERRATQ